jgi:hypothetical protein
MQAISHYGFDNSHKLIADIWKTWGDNLEYLPDSDRYYLIYICSEYIGLHWIKEDASESADKISARIIAGELPITQVQKLIRDLSHNWDMNHPVLSDCDRYYIFTNLGWHIYQNCGKRPSDDADEIASRLQELPLDQLKAFIKVLAAGV